MECRESRIRHYQTLTLRHMYKSSSLRRGKPTREAEEMGPQKSLAINPRNRITIVLNCQDISSFRTVVVIPSVGILTLRETQLSDRRKPSILVQIHSHLASASSSDFYTLCLKSITLKLRTSCARASWRDGSRGTDYTMPGYRWVGIRWEELQSCSRSLINNQIETC